MQSTDVVRVSKRLNAAGFWTLLSCTTLLGCAGLLGCAAPLPRPTPLEVQPVHLLRGGLPTPRMPAVIVSATRIKNPVAHPLAFTSAQKQQIHAALEPGDVLLSYTAGVTSNLIVPGHFKHAFHYIGPPRERGALLPRMNNTETTAKLAESDVVEAVAEGVKFNQLDRILETRVNRLVVMRPHLSENERADSVTDVISYVGQSYDFAFNFHDGTKKSCTEVVCCSLASRGAFQIPFVLRAGRDTIVPDDLLRYHFRAPGCFSIVLLVENSPTATGQALVRFGDEAEQKLATTFGR